MNIYEHIIMELGSEFRADAYVLATHNGISYDVEVVISEELDDWTTEAHKRSRDGEKGLADESSIANWLRYVAMRDARCVVLNSELVELTLQALADAVQSANYKYERKSASKSRWYHA